VSASVEAAPHPRPRQLGQRSAQPRPGRERPEMTSVAAGAAGKVLGLLKDGAKTAARAAGLKAPWDASKR